MASTISKRKGDTFSGCGGASANSWAPAT